MPKRNTIVDDFLAQQMPNKAKLSQARYDDARGRRSKELDLWHRWNDNGRQHEHLEPLLQSIDPLLKKELRKRMQGLGGTMPQAALKQELRNAAHRAIETYDPTKSQLSSHITTNFMRTTDVISSVRNPKSNPRPISDRYGEFTNAQTEFEALHGRKPDPSEMKSLLPGWSDKMIKRMRKGFGSEVFSDMGTELEHDSSRPDTIDKIRSAIGIVRSQMSPDQQRFAELHYPPKGMKQKSVEQIAQTLGIPVHKAYKIKRMVENKIQTLVRSE